MYGGIDASILRIFDPGLDEYDHLTRHSRLVLAGRRGPSAEPDLGRRLETLSCSHIHFARGLI